MISIIVAIYNTEAYLPKCIDSILAQTHDNFEVILVNDGSTDRCGMICDEYAKKDKRITVIHQANKGRATASNVGIDAAKGEWLMFVDSDDWIDPDMCEILLQAATNEGTLLAQSAYISERKDGAVPFVSGHHGRVTPMTVHEFLRLHYAATPPPFHAVGTTVWATLFHVSLLTGLRFDESIFYMIDGPFKKEALMKIPNGKIAYVNKPMYHWLYREGSISKGKNIANFRTVFDAHYAIFSVFERYGATEFVELEKQKSWDRARRILPVYDIRTFLRKFTKQIIHESRRYPLMNLTVPGLNWKGKVTAFCFLLLPRISNWFYIRLRR